MIKFVETKLTFFSCTASHNSTTNQILLLQGLNKYSSLELDKKDPAAFASEFVLRSLAPQSGDA